MFHALKLLGGTIGFIVVIATAIQIWIDIDDRQDERSERREDAIERAWNRLLRPAVGNTGKGQAISLLVREGVPLDSVDLSCAAIGRWADGKCAQPVVFAGIEMSSESEAPMTFERNARNLIMGVDFSNAIIPGAQIRNFTLTGIISGASIRDLRFVRSRMQADLSGTEIWRGSLAFSEIDLSGAPPEALGVDISGTQADWIFSLEKGELGGLAAWADMPPYTRGDLTFKKMSEVLDDITLCEPSIPSGNSFEEYEERTPLIERYHFIKGWLCKDMTLSEARAAYPAAYEEVFSGIR